MSSSDKKYQVLIVDDHPLIVESYQRAFSFVEKAQNSMSFDIEVQTLMSTYPTILRRASLKTYKVTHRQ